MSENNKSFHEKVNNWIATISGILAVLGISVFGGIALLPDNNGGGTVQLSPINTNIPNITLAIKPTPIPTPKPTLIPTIEPITEPDEPIATIIENHTPNDAATNVFISEWDSDSDIGIDGNAYEGGHKITISNTFNALGSSIENKVRSRMIISLSDGARENNKTFRFTGVFVLDKDMFGSESSGTIKILINNKKVFSTGKIDGNTTKAFPFDISYKSTDSIIIQTNVTLKKSDFVYGFVDSKK